MLIYLVDPFAKVSLNSLDQWLLDFIKSILSINVYMSLVSEIKKRLFFLTDYQLHYTYKDIKTDVSHFGTIFKGIWQ